MIVVYSDIIPYDIEVMINRLCPNVEAELFVEIDSTLDVEGYCIQLTSSDIRIMLKRNDLLTLAHELVHAKQYLSGQLKQMKNSNCQIWKGKQYIADNFHCPWEQQAYALEKRFKKLIANN